jgi:hypothetical protein
MNYIQEYADPCSAELARVELRGHALGWDGDPFPLMFALGRNPGERRQVRATTLDVLTADVRTLRVDSVGEAMLAVAEAAEIAGLGFKMAGRDPRDFIGMKPGRTLYGLGIRAEAWVGRYDDDIGATPWNTPWIVPPAEHPTRQEIRFVEAVTVEGTHYWLQRARGEDEPRIEVSPVGDSGRSGSITEGLVRMLNVIAGLDLPIPALPEWITKSRPDSE